jgi:hypothetical protein
MDKDFRWLSLGLPARLVASGGLFLLGAAVELLLPAFPFLGAAIAILGWFPLMLKKASNKPKDQGLEEWRPVSMAEIDRLDDGLRESRKLKRRVRSPSTGILLGLCIPVFFITFLAGRAMGRDDVVYVILNAAIFLVPAFFFGRVRVFEPAEIAMKMPCFRAVLSEPVPEGVVVAPYIRFDKDDKGMDVPEDLRLLFELKRAPADLVGVQVQAAVNNGPNGAVPYLYAVVLTHGTDGPSHQAARRVRQRGYEVEAGGDAKYGTVVLRQETSGGGYCTTPDDCRRLAALCHAFLASLEGRKAATGA